MKKIPKKWRELSAEIRLKIPEKEFKLDTKDIERIRKIKNPRKKLIESAKLQYDHLKEIHSYLTTWIAGYSSDRIIRQYFGSTKNLRELFIQSPKIREGVTPSWMDIKRNIKIPDKMTGDLAEEIGIHIGDGNIYVTTYKDGSKSYQYSITGDLKDEKKYHKEHIKELMKRLYNIESRFSERDQKNSIETIHKSKAIVQFKNKILKLPVGSKKEIQIPKEIMENKEFQRRCVAGIIDTDFSITKFLAISGKINNQKAAEQIHKILDENNIKHIYKIYTNYSRFYISKNYAEQIVKKWKLNNIKHTSKFEVFEKFNTFIPYSTTQERLDLLNKTVNLNDLKEICNKRKSLRRGSKSTFSVMSTFRQHKLGEDSNL